MGQQVVGPQVNCAFDGSTLTVGGLQVPVAPSQMPQRTPPTDQELTRIYGQVPAVQARLAENKSIAEAVALFLAEEEALWDQMRLAGRSGGTAAARAVVESSTLVDRLEESDGAVLIWLKGLRFPFLLETEMPPPDPDVGTRARIRVETIVEALRATPFGGGSLVLVTHDGVSRFSGELRMQAKTQIEYAKRGGNLASLPFGPLRAEDSFLQDVARVAKAKGLK